MGYDQSNRRSRGFQETVAFIGTLAILSAIGGLIWWGQKAEYQNADRKAVQRVHLEHLTVPVTTLAVNMPDARILGGLASTGGKAPSTYRYWSAIEAPGWMLLNPARAGDMCGYALYDFVRNNGLKGVALNPYSIDMLVSASGGKEFALNVHVPTFTERPPHLGSCPGFSYDPETKNLMVGDRRVALLADVQPALGVQ